MAATSTWEFDQRYRRPRERRRDERVIGEARQIAQAQIDRLRTDAFRPKALGYFEEIVAGDQRTEELRALSAPKVAVFCNFAPEELIEAAGAVPLRVCAGFPSTITPAEEILPRDICPLVKSTFGMVTCGVEPVSLCDAAVLPLSCDPKTKLAQVLADYMPTWALDLPGRRDYVRDMPVWMSETKEFITWLQDLTGNTIRRRRLRDACERDQRGGDRGRPSVPYRCCLDALPRETLGDYCRLGRLARSVESAEDEHPAGPARVEYAFQFS